MNSSYPDLKLYEWKLVEVVGGLFHSAAQERSREAAVYYWQELERLGHMFFMISSREPVVVSPVISVPDNVKTALRSVAKKGGKQARGVKLNKPFGASEKAVLGTVFFSDEAPQNLEDLARVAYGDSYRTREQDPQRNGFIVLARCPRALALGLMRLRHVIEDGSAHKADTEFIKRFRVRFPNITLEQFDQIAQETLEKYRVDPKKYGFKSYGMESKNDIQPVLEFQPKAEWLQLLNIALFHPEGTSLDPEAVAKRIGIQADVGKHLLEGALKALRHYWKGEEEADAETETFMTMMENRWKSNSFSEILSRIGYHES